MIRASADDVLVRDGRAAVLIDGTLIRLSAVGWFIYAACAAPTKLDTLAMALEAEFGAPTGTSTHKATVEVVEEMLAHGVLLETT